MLSGPMVQLVLGGLVDMDPRADECEVAPEEMDVFLSKVESRLVMLVGLRTLDVEKVLELMTEPSKSRSSAAWGQRLTELDVRWWPAGGRYELER